MDAAVAPATAVPKSRASRPGSSGARTVVLIVILAILVATLGWGITGLVNRTRLNPSDPQSWLPRQQLDHPVDKTFVGTVAHPALTVEGDFVEVKTPAFSALAVVEGPVVPGEGLPVRQDYTTCTWTISLSHVHGTVPISIADFDTIDHDQTVYKPYLVPGHPTPPASLHSGQDLSFQIRVVMPVGEGLMRWAPDGNNIVAKWDYQVEND